MPTYDYVCKTCGRTFEYFQSIKADKLNFCPEEICNQEETGKGAVERKISSGAGVIFTGDGFYQTDYVRSDEGGTPKKAAGSDAGNDAKTTDASSKSDKKDSTQSSTSTSAD